MTTIELTDEEAQEFIAFRKNKSEIEAILPAWKQVMEFTKQLGNGSLTLVVQDGIPVHIKAPLKSVLIVNLTK